MRAVFHGELLISRTTEGCREAECDQHQGRHQPEQQLVGGTYLRNRADLAWSAGSCRAENTSPGEEQRHQCGANEERPVRFQYGQVADPRPAESQGD